MTTLFVLLSLLMAGLGTLGLNQATGGVGLICLGCWFGIMARLYQASNHHDQRRRAANHEATTQR